LLSSYKPAPQQQNKHKATHGLSPWTDEIKNVFHSSSFLTSNDTHFMPILRRQRTGGSIFHSTFQLESRDVWAAFLSHHAKCGARELSLKSDSAHN
jgi:hypothetical protein